MEEDYRLSTKQAPTYVWHTKEEGKKEYAKFVKEYTSTACKLRYILEPGGVECFMGRHPGPRPSRASRSKEWREDMREYDKRARRVEEDCAAALSLLERSFPYGTTPAHIIDKTIKNVPEGVPLTQWTYRRKFSSCWDALRLEYQPSSSTDLKQLKEQISKLTDEGRGGFDEFRAEFHRLHAEITATGVHDAITTRELNEIVRDGIKNKVIWMNVCHSIYSSDPNAPWETTFQAVATALTSYRQKDIDPYAEAKGGLTLGSTPVTANNAAVPPQQKTNKRMLNPNREADGRPFKMHKNLSPPNSHELQRRVNPSPHSHEEASVPRVCTRCWNSGHSYKTCNSTECACGSSLTPGQLICYKYDSHPADFRFRGRMPKFLQDTLESYQRCNSANTARTNNFLNQRPKKPWPKDKKRGISALAVQVIEELARRGYTDESEDESS